MARNLRAMISQIKTKRDCECQKEQKSFVRHDAEGAEVKPSVIISISLHRSLSFVSLVFIF